MNQDSVYATCLQDSHILSWGEKTRETLKNMHINIRKIKAECNPLLIFYAHVDFYCWGLFFIRKVLFIYSSFTGLYLCIFIYM